MVNDIEMPAIKDAQAYLAAIVDSSDDAIISKDLNGNITSWNKSAELIFGYSAREAIGKHISIIIPPDYLNDEDYIIEKVRAGERVDHFETIRRKKDGTLINISVTVSPIKNAQGEIIGASKIARDITQRIQAEQKLAEASSKKEEFLANMSHELRTPMNAVIGLANLLSSMDNLSPKARTFVQTLKVSADNMLDLINDLLDFAKIENGTLELDRIEFDMAEQIEKVIAVGTVKAREKGLRLHVDYDDSIKTSFMGDPLRFHQVLMNLVSNAIKFTDKGSVEIGVSVEPSPDYGISNITIRVKDTGIGIDPDKVESIFDKFVQADNSMTRRYGGSGLGLAIAKACVEKMGGTITVSSKPGMGSVFTILLPLEIAGASTACANLQGDTVLKIVPQKRNVLVVDDYEPNIFVIGSMLDLWGFDYEVAQNGIEAIKKFETGLYDVILMDMQMHEMDGLEATRHIRQVESEKRLPRTNIIAMTAHVRDQDKDKCFSAGMDDFIPKPFEPAVLAEKITSLVAAEQAAG